MNDSTVVTLIVSGILFGTPLALAAVGEILAERSGVLNLGIEGCDGARGAPRFSRP